MLHSSARLPNPIAIVEQPKTRNSSVRWPQTISHRRPKSWHPSAMMHTSWPNSRPSGRTSVRIIPVGLGRSSSLHRTPIKSSRESRKKQRAFIQPQNALEAASARGIAIKHLSFCGWVSPPLRRQVMKPQRQADSPAINRLPTHRFTLPLREPLMQSNYNRCNLGLRSARLSRKFHPPRRPLCCKNRYRSKVISTS